MPKRPSDEDIKELYVEQELSQRQIAERFGKSQPYISRRMSDMDIESRCSGKWTEREKRILCEKYKEVSREELKDLLPDRSWNAIKLKAIDMGLAAPMEEHRQSEEVRRRLQRNTEERKIKVDFSRTNAVSYVLGVIEGDGYHDGSTIGLEVKSEDFADKFERKLRVLGMNPGRGDRRGKQMLWAGSTQFVRWYDEKSQGDLLEWLISRGDGWQYIEGRYDSDGNLHPSGSPRICTYDESAKDFLLDLFDHLEVKVTRQQNNIWVAKSDADHFFEHVNCVLDNRMP